MEIGRSGDELRHTNMNLNKAGGGDSANCRPAMVFRAAVVPSPFVRATHVAARFRSLPLRLRAPVATVCHQVCSSIACTGRRETTRAHMVKLYVLAILDYV